MKTQGLPRLLMFVPRHLSSKLNLLGNGFATIGKSTKKRHSSVSCQPGGGGVETKDPPELWLRNLTLVPPG